VERKLTILSDPPGAMVWLDGQPIGKTPITVPFAFYGTREISLYYARYQAYTTMQEVPCPWYQYFPIDFVSEFLIPLEYTDNPQFHYTLKPQLPCDDLQKQALEARGQALQAKFIAGQSTKESSD